MGQRN